MIRTEEENTEALQHRQASARLRVLKPDGTPAANRPVCVDQDSHRFLFGCGALS